MAEDGFRMDLQIELRMGLDMKLDIGLSLVQNLNMGYL